MKKFFFNRCFDKNRLKHLISWSLIVFGEKNTIKLVEDLKDIGFGFATEAGISLSIDDLKIPPTKSLLISEAEIDIFSTEYDYLCGNLTAVERFQKMIDIWHRTSENLKQNVVHYFRSTDVLNPVYMMAFSGARGNISQVRQLVGMRGLMADPQGQIIDFPIRSNFREGLTLTEYIISCYGARKGLVDTALRTANSGYLTRRLVDVAQHILICQLDCGTKRGIYLNTMKEGNKILLSLQNRLIGRIVAEDIKITKEEIIFKNQDISSALAAKIIKVKKEVFVRSPLTCEAKNSICQLCYGWSLAHGSLVSLGEAVGVLAAQSIGEPGTQLTMRTFHTGGVFSGDMMDEIRSPFKGIIVFKEPFQGILIRTSHGKIAFLTKNSGEFLVKSVFSEKKEGYFDEKTNLDQFSVSSSSSFPPKEAKSNPFVSLEAGPKYEGSSIKNFFLPISSILFVRHGEQVLNRQLLAEYSSISTQKNQRIQSKHDLNSNFEGQIYFENVLLSVKNTKEGDFIRTAKNLGSMWILSGKIYQSLIVSNFFPKIGDLVNKNSIMDQFLLISPINGLLETNKKLIKNFSSNVSLLNRLSKPPQSSNQQKSQKPLIVTEGEKATKEIYLKKLNPVAQSMKGAVSLMQDRSMNDHGFFKKKEGYFSLLKQGQTRRDRKNDYQEKNNYLFLKKLFFNFVIKKINYKKFGYFFSNYSKQNLNELFFCNSVLNPTTKFDEMSFSKIHSFSKNYKTSFGGFYQINNYYINEDVDFGQIFWIPEQNYESKKFYFFYPKNLKQKNLSYRSLKYEEKIVKNNFKFNNQENASSYPSLKKAGLRNLNYKTGKVLKKKLFQNLKKYSEIIIDPHVNETKLFYDSQNNNFLKSQRKNLKNKNPSFLFTNVNSSTNFNKELRVKDKKWIHKKNLLFFILKNEGKKNQVFLPFDGLLELKSFNKLNISDQSRITNQSNFLFFKYRSSKFCRNSLANSRLQLYLYRSSHICFLFKNNKKTRSVAAEQSKLKKKIPSSNVAKSMKGSNSICFFSNLKIKPGWVYFPKNEKYNFKNHKKLIIPGKNIIDDIFFQYSPVFLEYFPIFSNFFIKKKIIINYKKSYNNWILLRIILLDKNFKGIKNLNAFLPKLQLGNTTKNSLYTRVFPGEEKSMEGLFHSSAIGQDFYSTKTKENKNSKIFYFFNKKNKKNRWNFNKKNFYYQNFFLLIRKVSEYSLINLKKFKKDFYSKNKKTNELFSSKKFLSNQQQIISLYDKNLSVDFNIQSFYTFKSLKKKFSVVNINIFDIFISLEISKNLYVKKPRLKFNKFGLQENLFLKQKIFNIGLEFALLRKIETTDYMNLRNTKIFIYKENNILKKNKVLSISFFSPFEGQIIKTQLDSLGKKNCLLLTNNDQITFSITNLQNEIKNFFFKKTVGQFIRSNENLGPASLAKCFNQSGQIIEIDLNKIVIRRGQPILFSSRGLFHIENNDFVQKGSPLLTLFYQRLKTGDIVQGIPKIEEFFEARQTKEGEILPENLHNKLLELFQNYKQKFNSQEAARKSIQKIQQILVEGVLRVYQSQGVSISDKHLEIIVRQMTSKVKIIDGGQTGLLRGELIDLQWIEIVNQGLENQKAEYEPIVLGITKASLETESFISAASFQETTRILSRAAIERKTDFLRGLKENVILGHLVPAGTGFSLSFDPENIKYFKKTSIEESLSDIFY
uniref:DNA-directed RNA polymerase subunit beta'' n=1 Tax=Interfilum terricola TaxID=163310 RepID=A0A097KPM3_9VIRI|nr:beta'' subunit of RNA polymerase [Interfilum terricola]AIT95127.1 beta'' subunit of RNA polymerase [Interfilum terricola]